MPGYGKNYCVICSRYFATPIALQTHAATKAHKRRCATVAVAVSTLCDTGMSRQRGSDALRQCASRWFRVLQDKGAAGCPPTQPERCRNCSWDGKARQRGAPATHANGAVTPPAPPRAKVPGDMAANCGISPHTSCHAVAHGLDAQHARPQLWLPPPTWSVNKVPNLQRPLAISAVQPPPRRSSARPVAGPSAHVTAPTAEQTAAPCHEDELVVDSRTSFAKRQAVPSSRRTVATRDHGPQETAAAYSRAAGPHAQAERRRPAARHGGDRLASQRPAGARAAAFAASSRRPSSAASRAASPLDGDLSARLESALASFTARPQHGSAASDAQLADSTRQHCRQVTYCGY